ncbi:MAG: hypothetical protein ACK4PG_14355 [Acetobacteraceae bacterium]
MLIHQAMMIRALTPPLDADRLPATGVVTPRANTRDAAKPWFVLAAASFVLIAPFVLVIDLIEGFPNPLESLAIVGIAPAAFSAVALIGLWRRRREPERLAISLSRDEVTVESDHGRVTRPVAEFAGITVLTHVIMRGDLPRDRPPTDSERRRFATRRPAPWQILTAIVLVHDEPSESVPIWATEGPDPDPGAAQRAARFARVLGLPMLADTPAA